MLPAAAIGGVHAFACLGGATVVLILAQAANFDVRYTGYVHDRFLLYLVPPVLIGMVCAVDSPRRPRYSLALVTAVVACGFATGSFPDYTWHQFATLNEDSLMSGFLKPVVHLTGSLAHAKLFLAGVTVALAALYLGGSLLSRRVGLATVVVAAVVLPAATIATFDHFFATNGWVRAPGDRERDRRVRLHRPDRRPERPRLDDPVPRLGRLHHERADAGATSSSTTSRSTGTCSKPTRTPTPTRASGSRSSCSRSTRGPAGRTSRPTAWVTVSDKDTRFALAGTPRLSAGDFLLVKAVRPWRAQWLSFGLYDDGWTKPGVTARIRIFPAPGQRRAQDPDVRVRRPRRRRGVEPAGLGDEQRRALARQRRGRGHGAVRVCVPANGFTEIRLATPKTTTIPGDAATLDQSMGTRQGGVYFGATELAGEVGPPCRPR